MTEQPTGADAPAASPKQQGPLDPLRRVFIPIERKGADGVFAFQTTDRERYVRTASGSIQKRNQKLKGKSARRHEREARRLLKAAK